LNDEIVAEMRAAEFSGAVRLGVPHDLVAMLMPPILRVFRQAHPNVLVTLVSDTSRALGAQLMDGAIDLTLLTDSKLGAQDHRLMTDRMVWVGAKGGDAHKRRPLPVALGTESCAFRAAAVQALTKAGIEWRAICQVGSLEPVFATLEADMAIAAFLSRTVPERLAVLEEDLPKLPKHLIALRAPATGISPVAAELARHIKEGFDRRYS
jgi:DNA-binding transcriptional LysR family regulator